ncbi:MAG: hypothetical protein J6A01_11250, partial [Proteobacteria bacterium]|nr:hypothetical protein [Pseudomonadota bacterium]
MKKRNLLILACILCMYGCSDDSSESQDPTPQDSTCDCQEDETCVDGVCQKQTTPHEDTCDPKCPEGQTCIDGRCGVCIGGQCFFPDEPPGPGPGPGPEDENCEKDSDCDGDNQMCSNGECVSAACDPECPEGQNCVRGRCKAETLLWDLCNNQADCLSGQCVYYLTPSKEMQMEVNGEIQTFNTNNPIPVTLLDERINAEYYNMIHPEVDLGPKTMVGICSYECTKEIDKECPMGWECQVVAKGILSYPTSGKLPFELEPDEVEKTPFAALCRPNVEEPYHTEMCTASEADCKAAGLAFYEGMCLEPCDDASKACPFLFSCENAKGASGAQKVCMPVGGTCTSCYDHDGDGAGYGHCELEGIDCDEDNPNAYYQKPLTCDDISDNKGNPLYKDLNCNGYIDRFELLGNSQNCNACGEACNTPKSSQIEIQCVSTVDGIDAAEWYKTASADTEVPEFKCVEQCAFGYGDCDGNAKCNTALLEDSLLNLDNKEDLLIRASLVRTGKDAAALIYARDADGDGFPILNKSASIASKTDDKPAEIILDGSNTVICCSNDTDFCYTANKDWKSLHLSDTTQQVKDEKGDLLNTISYVLPCGKRLACTDGECACKDDECTALRPDCYDSDDEAPAVNPLAVEKCDGVDNDGSQILLSNEHDECSTWCKDHEETCASFTVKHSTENGESITYLTNPYCDATPEGLNEPNSWIDPVQGTQHETGAECTNYHPSGSVCNEGGTVICKPNAAERCIAGSENCGCATKANKAFIITEANHGENPKQEDYIRYTSDLSSFQFCRCDNSRCEGSVAECNAEGKDSVGCFLLCGQLCTMKTSYALSCDAEIEGTLDGIVEKSDNKVEFDIDGIDNNCNGLTDEDAWVPCIFKENHPSANLESGEFNGNEIPYNAYLDDSTYSINVAENTDHSINLCRLGIQKTKAVQDSSGNLSYKKYCMPIYKPRKYDFYGDGIDSNCDGADYDILHTTFVVSTKQGTSTQTPSDASCKYDAPFGTVTPCNSINMAINGGQNGVRIAKDSEYEFYHDILLTSDAIDYTPGFADAQGSYPSPIYMPEYDMIKQLQNLDIPNAKEYPDEAGHVSKEHFISAYAVHRYFVDQYRKNAKFDANRYLFSFWHEKVNGTKVDYEIASPSEMQKPEEVFRIFGGFTRTPSSNCAMPTECDYWQNTGNAQTSITWTVRPQNDRRVYSLVDGSDLSLRLTNVNLTLSSEALCSDSECKINEQESRPNNKALADGVTLIGINGTRYYYRGFSALTLDNTTITVTAPEGYSYNSSDTPGQETNGTYGWAQGYSWRIPKENDNFNSGNGTYPDFNYSRGCDKYDKDPNDSNICYSIKNRKGQEYVYSDVYSQDSYILDNMNCGYGLEPNRVTQSTGGMGGYAHTQVHNYGTWYNGSGKKALPPRKKVDGEWKNLGDNEYGKLGKGGFGGPHLFTDDHVRNNDPADAVAFGEGGGGGKHGAVGENKYTELFWNVSGSQVSVMSNRSKARGHYGQPGGGGGGGGVDYCWMGYWSSNHWCLASSGGSGGCGGKGGEA